MEKRYQVFVSSTYEDLREERQEVMQALLELDCIPSGMELFPAADDDQWTLIKKVIDDCDYYLVIIAGRYGSSGPDGKSYTQMEYEYAASKGKPIIAFLHADPGKILAERTDPEHRDNLQAFRELAQKKLCKTWSTPQELGSVVSRGVIRLIKDRPGVGWVRSDEVLDPKQTLEDMSNLQAENARLVKRVAELEKKFSSEMYNGLSFDELVSNLGADRVPLEGLPGVDESKVAPLLNLFNAFADKLTVGVTNFHNMSDTDSYVFFTVAPKLAVYGLVEKKNINNRGVQRFQTSALGNRFLAKFKPMFRKTSPASTEVVHTASPDKSRKKPTRRRLKPAQG